MKLRKDVMKMLIIEDGKIYLTRGDDASLNVNVSMDGAAYEMQDSDTLTLTVRELPDKDKAVLLRVESSTSTLALDHAQTETLSPGKYSADIQLTLSDGKRITVWPEITSHAVKNWGNFIILPEVS